MKEELNRQASGSTGATTTTVTSVSGTGTVDSADVLCGCPQPGPETIDVEQVLGAGTNQRVVEFDIVLPSDRPNIKQVIDVYVKDVCITDIDLIFDKVIIRGNLEVKVMYVADLPDEPVFAYEKKHIRFTRDIALPGAAPGMNATADVVVEFIDYDFDCWCDPRKVHITIVLKFWTRVTTTTALDVYALSPIDEIGTLETTTASGSLNDSASALGQFGNTVSASQTGGGDYGGYIPENMMISGMEPVAGTTQGTVAGTATVKGTNVNVRTGPGTTFPVVTKVNTGDVVTLKDSAFGWNRVVLPDGTTTGWIASWLLNAMPTAPKG
ncbi:MAG: DUF3794 domain-containing protein [Sporomusaceae bacterium]|nr:DUF3794 domain-containing protein [Sporomusaceae bacterium]